MKKFEIQALFTNLADILYLKQMNHANVKLMSEDANKQMMQK